nr:hypothetical protein [Tanacetum cinerariifolium]
MWSDQEKKIQKIDRLARSLLIQGLPNDIYSLIDSNKTAKDLWDAVARHMLGSKYGEQDKKAAVLYDNKTAKDLWDAVARHMLGSKYGEQDKKAAQNQGDVNDAMILKKKTVVVNSDPLALIAEKTKVSKRKEKVVVSSNSEGSDADDFSELKKITTLLAKAFNRRKFYSKPTNNNLRTSSTSQSLPSGWNTHVVVWRNKSNLDIMSINDLYNKFKIIEQEVKGTTSSNSSSQNIAFMSYPSSTNEVNTAYEVGTANTQVNTASTQINTANLSDATVYAFLASQPNGSQLAHKNLVQIHKDNLEDMDLKWQLALLSMRTRSKKDLGYESYHAVSPPPTGLFSPQKLDLSNSDLEEFKQPEFESYGPKTSKSVSEDISTEVKESSDVPLVKKLIEEVITARVKVSTTRDAKTLFAAIKTRFGRTKATKRTLLKQLYNNFSAPSTESLDSIFNRLQKIRNKSDLDTMSIDDLYNNFKIVKQEVKGTTYSDSSSQNMAFMTSPSTNSTNEVLTAYGVSTASTQSSTAGTKVSTDNLSDATIHAFLSNQSNGQPRNQDNRSWNQDSSRRIVNVEETPPKAMVAIDGDSKVYTNNTSLKSCLKRYETLKKQYDDLRVEFNRSEINLVTYKRGLASVEEKLIFYKKNEVIFCEQIAVLKRDLSYRDSEISGLKRSKITDKSRKGVGFKSYNVVPPPPLGLFSPPKIDLSYSEIPNELKESLNAPLVKDTVSDNKDCTVVSPIVVQEDQGYVDNGCSRHMTRNMSYLLHFKEFNRGYVTFGGGANGGRITGKGTIHTGNLDFEDVYFVKELKFNLFSVSQMCDKKNNVLFTDIECLVLSPNFKFLDENHILLRVPRRNNMYSVYMKNIVPKESLTCLVAKATLDELMLWHRRLGHINFKNINKLVKDNLVRGLPSKCFENDQSCVACLKGKQHKASLVSDDYSRFTWVFYLATKDETSGILKKFITEIENLVDKKVKGIRSDNETEFKNSVLNDFCAMNGIKREFSIARTPQQNGVTERRNWTPIEAAKTMLTDSKLPTKFWAEVVNTGCHVQNRVLVVKPHNKTLYELFRGRSPALSFMKPFGCYVTLIDTLDHVERFDGKADKGYFVRYSMHSKAFRVYNIRTRRVEENLHIEFLENKPIVVGIGPKWLFDIDMLTESMNYVPVIAGTNSNNFVGTKEHIDQGHYSKERGYSQDYILMPLWKDGSLFDSSSKNPTNDEPQSSCDAENKDDSGVNIDSRIDAHEKSANSINDVNTVGPSINTASTDFDTGSLNINIVSPIVSTASPEATHADFLCDQPEGDISNIISTYQVLSTPNTRIYKDHSLDLMISDVNKKDERGIMIKNKARLVAYGFTQEEGIDYDEVFALVARIEAIRLFLAYASFMGFMVYQMDVKSAFLYGRIEEEDKYVTEDLKNFNLLDAKTANTPLNTKKSLVKDADSDDVDVHLYRSMIRSLMYLTTSRPDIMVQFCRVKDQQSQLSPFTHPQPSSPTHTHIADEATSTGVDVRYGGAATTVSSLDAGQGSGIIDKTPSMAYDSPLLRVNTLGRDKGSMKLNELIVLYTKLSQKVDSLEVDLKQNKQVYEATYTKLIMKVKRLEKTVKSSQVRRRAKIVVSDDEELEDHSKQGMSMIEEINQDTKVTLVTPIKVSTQREAQSQESLPEDQLGVFSATKVLVEVAKVHTYTRRRRAISTASGGISTAKESVSIAGASMPVSTAGMVDKVVRLQEQLDEEERHRIARVHEEASSFVVDEWEDIQAKIKADDELELKIQAKEMEKYYEAKKARLLVDLINQRKRYFTQQRTEERTSNDETSGILKKFITLIENLVDKKLKVIGCDNRTEFKNSVMNEFYAMKGNGPKWLFDIDVLTKSMNYVPVVAGNNAVLSLCFIHEIMVYQMVIKSTFLYGRIEEEVYVCQPLGFEDPNHPDKVYKVVKELYVLHQAPRAWYETLAMYLLGNQFHRGKIDQTLFIKRQKGDILRVQVNVDDIIFSFTKKELCTKFERLMKDKFQMSSMGEFTFFLGLQVKHKEDGVFISQDKYVAEVLRKFNLLDVKSTSTPVHMEKTLVKDADGDDVDVHLYRSMIGSLMYLTTSRPDIIDSPFELVAYTDSDYAATSLDKKSTTEGCQFLGSRLIACTLDSESNTGLLANTYYFQLKVNAAKYKFTIVVDGYCCREKPTESEGFEQIIDFLDANPIKYALTVNLTIYTSCIKQFLATAKVETINGEKHIQALVDKKKMIITEASLTLMSDSTHDVADEHVATTSNDPLLCGEDRLKLTVLIELCTKLQSRVLALETTKANQALEIGSLKKRVKKLQKKAGKKTHKLKRLYKIGSSKRVESSEDAGLGDMEDASKQRRMIADLDADEGVALVDETHDWND